MSSIGRSTTRVWWAATTCRVGSTTVVRSSMVPSSRTPSRQRTPSTSLSRSKPWARGSSSRGTTRKC
eukprot:9553659-Alexandrium_andersonii.AAC.1